MNTFLRFTRIFALSLVLATASTHVVSAAPIWIERQFVPQIVLKDALFENHDATSGILVDHTAWGSLLATHLTQAADGVAYVNYSAFTDEERMSLDNYIKSLEAIDVTTLAPNEQLAFWINLYNAATVKLILENYPLASIQDIDDAWDMEVATVNGISLTLNEIEHGIIRPVFKDNRIHYAVNCASIGCPNLAATPFTGATLNDMLDASARAYVNHPRGVRFNDNGDVIASKIYGWYREDFGDNRREVIAHLRKYAAPDLAARLEKVRRIRKYEYNWDLNDAAGLE